MHPTRHYSSMSHSFNSGATSSTYREAQIDALASNASITGERTAMRLNSESMAFAGRFVRRDYGEQRGFDLLYGGRPEFRFQGAFVD